MLHSGMPYFVDIYHSPIGILMLTASEAGLVSAEFEKERHLFEEQEIHSVSTEHKNDILTQTKDELDNYFAGNLRNFTIPLHPKGTSFQHQVWNSLHQIAFGKTTTYLKQSQLLGNEKAIRAVAAANGANPIAIIIPCHRVIGSNGKLTGYRGGLNRKAWLLHFEKKHSL